MSRYGGGTHPHTCGGPGECHACDGVVEHRGLDRPRPVSAPPGGWGRQLGQCGVTWTTDEHHHGGSHTCTVALVQRGGRQADEVQHPDRFHICECRACTDQYPRRTDTGVLGSEQYARERGLRYEPRTVTPAS